MNKIKSCIIYFLFILLFIILVLFVYEMFDRQPLAGTKFPLRGYLKEYKGKEITGCYEIFKKDYRKNGDFFKYEKCTLVGQPDNTSRKFPVWCSCDYENYVKWVP